jgi:hypothetical protein
MNKITDPLKFLNWAMLSLLAGFALQINGVHAQSIDCSAAPLVAAHLKANLVCTSCHKTVPTGSCDINLSRHSSAHADVACITCHVSIDEVAKRTANRPRNPHTSPHFKQLLTCTDCHHAHTNSDEYCTRCHDPVATKPGWLTTSQPAAVPPSP